MPLGVQLIGAPYQEAKLLRVAWVLEREGVVKRTRGAKLAGLACQ